MFKKRERKGQSQNARRKRDDDDGSIDGDNDQSGSVNADDELQTVLTKTKQRRTLIHQLQYKRGVDAHELLQQGNKSGGLIDDMKLENVEDHTNLSTRVDALSSKTQLPTGGTIVAEEQRIWDLKHAAAMEEYVQQKLSQKTASLSQQHSSNDVTNTATTETESHRSSGTTTIKSLATAKEQLYRELAAQAAKLSGKSSTGTATEQNGSQSQSQRHDDSNSNGDVLTAGAATAIMEVILPIDDRLQAVTATAHAAAAIGTTNAQPSQSMPYVRNKNSAVPNRFRSSYNHHHPMVQHSTTNGIKKRSHNSSEGTTESSSSSLDKERPGFAVARQLQQQQQQQQQHGSYRQNTASNHYANNNQNQSRSTDDRVYQQFIKRQREQHGR